MGFESNGQDFQMDVGSDYDSNDETDGSEDVEDLKKPTTKKGEQGVCVKCNKKKRIQNRSMCSTCYQKDLRAKHEKEGRMTANLVTCLKCNQLRKHRSRGLCHACYLSVLKSNQLEQYSKRTRKSQRGLEAICVQCNKTRKIHNLSMCWTCYNNDLKARRKAGEKKCSNCKRLRQLEANGFCSQCNLNNVKSEEIASDQELETNSNALDQELEANPNALDQELETNSIDLKESPITYASFMIVRTDFVKRIELVGNPTTFEIDMQSQEVIDEFLNASQLKENVDQTVLTSSLVFDSEDKRFTTEDFISKLTQYTRSKLKPLQKKRIKSSVKKPLKAKQSILNVSNEKDHVSQSRPIQLAKKSSKAPISKGPIAPIRLTKMPISKGPMTSIKAETKERTTNQINENLQKCSDCQQMKPHHAKNLCSVCYQRLMTEKEETATKSNTNQTGRKRFFVKSDEMNQKINLSQYELLFGTSRKRKLQQSDDETFSGDEFYSMF